MKIEIVDVAENDVSCCANCQSVSKPYNFTGFYECSRAQVIEQGKDTFISPNKKCQLFEIKPELSLT